MRRGLYLLFVINLNKIRSCKPLLFVTPLATATALSASTAQAQCAPVHARNCIAQPVLTLSSGDDAQFRAKNLSWAPPAVSHNPRRQLVQPVAFFHLSSRFGERSDPFRGLEAMHTGVDVPGTFGTPILASDDGIVVGAGGRLGYGNLVEIDHGGGISTRYAHLSTILVSRGMIVQRGQIIARMGSTGRSTGNHLHYEVLIDGHPVDPLAYLSGTPAPSNAYGSVSSATAPHLSGFAQARNETSNLALSRLGKMIEN